MADSFQAMAALLLQGLKDAGAGVFMAYRVDQAAVELEKRRREELQHQQQTILAKRRAQRMPEVVRQDRPRILHRIVLCCSWNAGVFWLSILIFWEAVLPALRFVTENIFGGSPTHGLVWTWITFFLSAIIYPLWIVPLFLLSKVVNSLWFQDIADAAYRKSHGRPVYARKISLGKMIADLLFSVLMQSLFLIQTEAVKLIPIAGVGQAASFVHLSLLCSLYSFEYKWFNMGWEVQKRVTYVENNWLYFLGFGLPLALLTSLPSSFLISGCVFSILFPLFIIGGNEAKPPMQQFSYPLRLFTIVTVISNKVFNATVGYRSVATTSKPSPKPERKETS
uniref:Etoposide-induced protein 2.4 homolog n=1 Tax=Branchiostoma floridae TaxID=7739 RepID=C3YX28_BRAFL|eukprot:XP_002599034.1 hypothetical protein BRAFLDRAFT_104270 [Branchiostoma floridae]